MSTLAGANTTAQWYADNFDSSVFSILEKFVVHTTETGSSTSTGWPGYSSGAVAPNATYDPRSRSIRQHFPNNESSRALADPSGTIVRENRDNVFQLEIICYSQKSLADSRGGLWVGNLSAANYQDLAKMMIQLNKELKLPLQSSVTWGTWTNGAPDSIRLTGPQYDAYKGILGHMHVSGNSHWDPGAFSWTKLKAAIEGSLDMPLTSADITAIWRYPVHRTTGDVFAIQELADAKSNTIALLARVAALETAVAQLAAGEDLSAAEMTQVIHDAIEDAVVDVEVTVKDETP